jgi:hypothetical protein
MLLSRFPSSNSGTSIERLMLLCFRETNGPGQLAGFPAYRMIEGVRRRNSYA